jgi:hypothetical protein
MSDTKIHLSNPSIGFFIVDKHDKIIDTGDTHKGDWERTYVEMDKSKMNGEIYVSFNKKQNEKIGKTPVYVELNCKITKIETL